MGVGGSYDSAEIGETNSDFKGVRLNFMQIQSIFLEAKYDFIIFFLLLIGVSLQRLETKKRFWNLERVEWPTISVD